MKLYLLNRPPSPLINTQAQSKTDLLTLVKLCILSLKCCIFSYYSQILQRMNPADEIGKSQKYIVRRENKFVVFLSLLEIIYGSWIED